MPASDLLAGAAGPTPGPAHDDQRYAAPDDTIHNALRLAVEVETRRYLWVPSDAITFTPPLADTIFGDGRALFTLTTINDRPAYWIVRGDSRWDVSDYAAPRDAPWFGDMVDEIINAVEAEFGSGRWDEDDNGKEVEGQPFPAIDDEDGCSWGRMSWPVLPGIEIEPHPFAPDTAILFASRPTPTDGDRA